MTKRIRKAGRERDIGARTRRADATTTDRLWRRAWQPRHVFSLASVLKSTDPQVIRAVEVKPSLLSVGRIFYQGSQVIHAAELEPSFLSVDQRHLS